MLRRILWTWLALLLISLPAKVGWVPWSELTSGERFQVYRIALGSLLIALILSSRRRPKKSSSGLTPPWIS